MDDTARSDEAAWPQRTWLLALLGAVIALVINRLSDLPTSGNDWGPRLVVATMLFLAVAGVAFALGWRRARTKAALGIAVICGLTSGGVFIWSGLPDDGWSFGIWPIVAGLVASIVFLTLFQASDARGPSAPERLSWSGIVAWKRRALRYADVHEAIWTDGLLILAALLFTLVLWLVAQLLAEMFALVKIDLLRQILQKSWCAALLAGAGFGGAIGILRERAPIIAALQRVVMVVLRVLAPVLALGLVAFLAVLPFTGLAPLWATGNTTGLMLGAAMLALFLTNAVIGNRPDEEGVPPLLRYSAMALGLVLLPLAVIAAWSTGLRVGQYGLTPDRLWAIAFIAMGIVTAFTYAWAIVRAGDRIGRLHRGNLNLALLLGLAALILSTPLLGFNRIATASQMARLAAGKVKPVDFDYRALWFDFGPPGRAAIRALAGTSPNGDVRRFAADVQKLNHRYEDVASEIARRSGDALDARLTIVPNRVPLEPALRARLTDYALCGQSGKCLLYYVPGAAYAVAVQTANCASCGPGQPQIALRGTGDWRPSRVQDKGVTSEALRAMAEAVRAGRVELRTVEGRRLFVDGKPVGELLEMENASTP